MRVATNKASGPSLVSCGDKFYIVFRLLGQQFTELLRTVGFHIPSDNTLRAAVEKELDIPPFLSPGFLPLMVEHAKKAYDDGRPLVLANDERKV